MQPFILKEKPQQKDLIPTGSYPARIYSMITLGTHKSTFKGVEKESAKIRITFELPTELKVFNPEKGEQPRVISQEYSLSLFEKANFRKLLDSCGVKGTIDGDGFLSLNIWDLLGKTCILSITETETPRGTFNTIESIAQPMKGMPIPDQINPTVVYNVSDHDRDVFSKLPEFIQDKIKLSPEFSSTSDVPVEHTFDDFV